MIYGNQKIIEIKIRDGFLIEDLRKARLLLNGASFKIYTILYYLVCITDLYLLMTVLSFFQNLQNCVSCEYRYQDMCRTHYAASLKPSPLTRDHSNL